MGVPVAASVGLLAQLAFAQVVDLPLKTEVDDRSRRMWPGRFGQAGTEDSAVGGVIPGRAEGESKRMLD